MHEVFKHHNVTLEQVRLLTEVGNLMPHRQADGAYPQEVLDGIHDNLVTKVQEDAMSSAVSRSFQPVGEYQSPEGKTRRSFIWKGLGKTAVQVAESGFEYHWSDAAHERVKLEIKESERSEAELMPGQWHVFISPRMSGADAEHEIAKSEHLALDDSIRTSYAVTNERGEVTGRQTLSILVRDIPLQAWVDMFRDPNNIFGRTFDIKNSDSALSVMELFSQLDLPMDALPEGPVTLLDAVRHYIHDIEMHSSVLTQIMDLRQDQALLYQEAKRTADEWLEFEKSLSDSLVEGFMQKGVKNFVMQLQNVWPKEVLELLESHRIVGSSYQMSIELAAVLEQAWEKINLAKAAVMVDDKRSLKGVPDNNIKLIKNNIMYLRTLNQGSTINYVQYAAVNSQLNHQIASTDIKTGGGCGSENKFRFSKKRGPNGLQDIPQEFEIENLIHYDNETEVGESDDDIGEVHLDRCRTGYCPSEDRMVKVGGCNVCLGYCQPEFDKGNDPAEVFAYRLLQENKRGEQTNNLLDLFGIKNIKVQKNELVGTTK